MTERRVVLCLDPAVEDRVLPQLVAAGHVVVARPVDAAEAAAVLPRAGADLAIVSADTRHLDAALVRAASYRIRLIVLAGDADQVSLAGRAGARLVLEADADLAAILAAADQEITPATAEPAAPEPRRPDRGRVIAVWGPTGAPGRTTTAITLATELAATGARVALVDADTTGAAVAPSLGLFDEAPGFAAACRLAAAGALDGRELDRIAQQHRGARGAVAVLTGIGRAARWPELSTDRVTAVLDVCRDWVDHVVVDVGFSLESDEEIMSDLFAPRRNAATLAALRAADDVVAVGAADPVGLARFVRAYGELVEIVETTRIAVVVTKVRGSAVGLNPGGQIRATLQRFAGLRDPVLVPNDPGGCDAALLTGRALPDASPRSPAVAVLRRLVLDRFVAPQVAPARRRFGRLRAIPA